MSRLRKVIATAIAGATSLGFLIAANNQQQQSPQTPVKYKKRADHLREVAAEPNYDVVIVGGGCNGAGVALEASTRGLRTLLIER